MTVFGVAMALERNPLIVEAIKCAGYDVVCHGWRWLHYQHVDEQTEREHMQRAIKILHDLFGQSPQAGIPGVIAQIPGGWWWRMVTFCMIAIIMAMICPLVAGKRS